MCITVSCTSLHHCGKKNPVFCIRNMILRPLRDASSDTGSWDEVVLRQNSWIPAQPCYSFENGPVTSEAFAVGSVMMCWVGGWEMGFPLWSNFSYTVRWGDAASHRNVEQCSLLLAEENTLERRVCLGRYDRVTLHLEAVFPHLLWMKKLVFE